MTLEKKKRLLKNINDIIIRMVDFFIALLSIIIFTPILLCVSVAIVLDTGFPIIFSQNRVGKNMEEFKIYKLRTMVVNAEQEGPKHTIKNDTRITKVGGFLRKTSLDELPQIINVIKGDMSLVGPRPGVKEHVNYDNKEEMKKYLVKPGITGYAQVNGRSMCTVEEKKAYELLYVDERSIKTNFLILLKTVKVVVTDSGSW